MSSYYGVGSPVGCWWIQIIEAAFERQAVLNTSLGCTML